MRMRVGAPLLVAGLVVAAGACSWPMAGQGPDRASWSRFDTRITPANVVSVTAGWTAADDHFIYDPVGDGGVVYQDDGSAELRALDAATGALKWSSGDLGGRGPIVRSDTLLTSGGATRCFLQTRSRTDGGNLTTVSYGDEPIPGALATICGSSRPLQVGSTVVVAHGGYSLALQWSECGNDRGFKAVRRLTAFDANLAVKWTHEVVTDSGCGLPTSGFPGPGFGEISSDGTRVFVTIPDLGSVQAFPLACSTPCAPVWSRQLPKTLVGALAPVVFAGDGGVAVADTAGGVTVLDPATGTIEWTANGSSGVRGLAATSTSLFVTRAANQLAVYPVVGCGQPTCPTTWTATLLAAPLAPVASGDVLWVPTTGKSILAFDARGCGATTCSSLKTLTTTQAIGDVAIVSGRVIARTGFGLETFGLPS